MVILMRRESEYSLFNEYIAHIRAFCCNLPSDHRPAHEHPFSDPHHPPHRHHHPPPRDLISPLIMKALILRILRDNPSYGYDLINKVSNILGSRVPRSVIYYHLNVAEQLGLVISKWEVSGKKAKRMYYITDSGEMFLEDIKKKLEKLRNIIEFIYS